MGRAATKLGGLIVWPQPDRLTVLVGEAIIEWSRIEATWAHIFLNLLYSDLGEPEPTTQPISDVDPYFQQKRDRAAAVFFSVPNSAQ